MKPQQGFAIWITGLPSSGKSEISKGVVAALRSQGIPIVVLESDALRRILTPHASYNIEERDRFYHELASIGAMIADSGVNVLFDATANRRVYRDRCRMLFTRFVEIYVECPLAVCMQRDPKGIYRRAQGNASATVPGLQAEYEQPLRPELVLDCKAPVEVSANRVLDKLKQLMYV
jgi:adenylylsulfate kinase